MPVKGLLVRTRNAPTSIHSSGQKASVTDGQGIALNLGATRTIESGIALRELDQLPHDRRSHIGESQLAAFHHRQLQETLATYAFQCAGAVKEPLLEVHQLIPQALDPTPGAGLQGCRLPGASRWRRPRRERCSRFLAPM